MNTNAGLAWARVCGEPLARTLGAELRPLRAYHSVGPYGAEGAVATAYEALPAGFAGLKIKFGFPSFAEYLAAVRAARRALGTLGAPGNAAARTVDYNPSLTLPEAMARCKALNDEGLEWIEEPVLADDLEGRARIAVAVTTPLQISKNFHGPSGMRAAIAARASSLVMPDAQFIHGVTGWLEASALAQAAGLPMSARTFFEASP